MAPVSADDQSNDQTKVESKTWSTATIIVGAVFMFLLFTFILTFIAFCIHKRKLRNKVPAEHRPRSYHPFRTETTDKSSLLSNAESAPEDERSSMYSRRRSSVSVYLDAEPIAKRATVGSMDSANLIPLHVAPSKTEESLAGHISNGSGVSAASSRYSRGSISLSAFQQDDGDLGTRPSTLRSTSGTSSRYYGRKSISPESVAAPQLPVPTIVRTVSD